MNACASILSQLLLNNCPPGPLETGPLQAEVERLKSKIFSMRTELQECEDLLQKHQTVLSIVRRVPLDVLGIIFFFVLPDCSTREDWQEATNLSLVCKDWHQAARFSHRPSSLLKLKDTTLDYENVMSWSRRVAEERSLQIDAAGWTGNCPLHRDTRYEATGYEAIGSECEFASPALLRLMAEGPVLDHLLFKDVMLRCYRHLLDLLASYGARSSPRLWGNLKKFTLCCVEDGCPPGAVMGPESIDVPPCITSLDLELPDPVCVKIGANTPPLLVPLSTFERLTSFSLKWEWYAYDGKALLTALAHCAGLETLAVNFQSGEWHCTDRSKVVKLPKLWKLELVEPQRDSIKFLDFIDTPALTHMDIHLNQEVKPDTLNSFIAKQSTISQGIGHVRVYCLGCSGWDICEFLRQVPHVTHLTLDRCIMPLDDFGRSFTNGPGLFHRLSYTKNTLPHLKVLEIFGLSPEISLRWLEDYINSRREEYADDGLKTVVVRFDPTWVPESCEESSLSAIEVMRDVGLSVCVEFSELFRTDLLDM